MTKNKDIRVAHQTLSVKNGLEMDVISNFIKEIGLDISITGYCVKTRGSVANGVNISMHNSPNNFLATIVGPASPEMIEYLTAKLKKSLGVLQKQGETQNIINILADLMSVIDIKK